MNEPQPTPKQPHPRTGLDAAPDQTGPGNGRAAAPRPPRVIVITCAVLEDEFAAFRRGRENVLHLEILEQGLHNEPGKLRTELQAAIDRLEDRPPGDPLAAAEAVVLGYGLCSRGIEGVRTRRCKLVVARAHDCITLLLGSKEAYAQYVKDHPGTYWYSMGWNRHGTPPGKERYDKLYQKYREQFGEEDAQFLMESEQHWFQTYSRAAFVDLSIGATDRDVAYTQQCAQWLGWDFDYCRGDPALLRDMLAGNWDEQRFLVLEPGQTLRMTADERVVEAVPGVLPGGAGVPPAILAEHCPTRLSNLPSNRP